MFLAAWNQTSQSITIPSKELYIVISGLIPDTVYRFRVFAQNVLGKSKSSEDITARTDEEG